MPVLQTIASNIRKKKGEGTDEEIEVPASAAPMPAPAASDEAADEKPSLNHRVAQAILGLAPSLVGFALGGWQGGATGGAVGAKAVGDYVEGEEKERLRKAKADEDKADRALRERQVATAEGSAKSEAEHRKVEEGLKGRELALKEKELGLKGDPSKLSKEQRLAKLSGEQRKLVDLQLMGLRGMQALKGAYAGGDNTFSLVGDNDFTMNASKVAEAFGRLQSGGAINKQEEARFLAMLPRPTDSTAIQVKKLRDAELEFASRLQNSGFSGEEFGIQPLDMVARAKEAGNTSVLEALEPQAHAAAQNIDSDAFKKLSRAEKIAILRGRNPMPGGKL
jgi:hypothetical protein